MQSARFWKDANDCNCAIRHCYQPWSKDTSRFNPKEGGGTFAAWGSNQRKTLSSIAPPDVDFCAAISSSHLMPKTVDLSDEFQNLECPFRNKDFLDILPKERRQALLNTKKFTNESAECVLAGTRRSKAFNTPELMYVPLWLHGQRLNCSWLLPTSIDSSWRRLIASQCTYRLISRIPCMYTHRKDWCRSLAKIRTKYGRWTKHFMDIAKIHRDSYVAQDSL